MKLAIYMAMILVLPVYVVLFSFYDVIDNVIQEEPKIIIITSSTDYSDSLVEGFWFCSPEYGSNYYDEYFCQT